LANFVALLYIAFDFLKSRAASLFTLLLQVCARELRKTHSPVCVCNGDSLSTGGQMPDLAFHSGYRLGRIAPNRKIEIDFFHLLGLCVEGS